MKLLLKRLLCFILIFQLSGCAQAIIQERTEKNQAIAEKFSVLETECEEEFPKKNKLPSLEYVICCKERVLSMLEKEGYADTALISDHFEKKEALIEEYNSKAITRKELRTKLKELETATGVAISTSESERIASNYRTQQIVVGAVVVAAVATGAYYASKNSGGGSSLAPDDHQGCCSYHGGMKGMCYAGRVVCNDNQLSPTCRC